MAIPNTCADKVYQHSSNDRLLALLPARADGRALDCGCGAGDNAQVLGARGWSVTGITISPQEQQLAARYCDQVFLGDLNEGVPAAVGVGFNLVVMSHVLEHLTGAERLLADVKRVLAPEGVVAVALPNALHCHVRFQFLVGRFNYTKDGILDETHVHFYTVKTAAELLRSSGFEIVDARVDGGLPLWKLRGVLPGPMVAWLDATASRCLPGLFGHQFLYVIRPAASHGHS
jgi:SAM-dependent methyltransferase